jgi:large subunit ribosomal protein L7Ae
MPAGNKKLRAIKQAPKGAADPMFPAAAKNFRIGNDQQPSRDLSRFVRWPRYVRLQRQKKILQERIKCPPTVNQFRSPLDRAEAVPLFKLLAKYQPETKAAKKERLVAAAADKANGGTGVVGGKPMHVKFGLNHVTYLVEQKKAKLVAIAADVEPIELVLWLPALCRKMNVPYMIVNNKSRLGQLVGQKKAAVVALTAVRQEDQAALDKLAERANERFNDNAAARRKWGGGVMGLRTQAKIAKREAALRAEAAKKAMY